MLHALFMVLLACFVCHYMLFSFTFWSILKWVVGVPVVLYGLFVAVPIIFNFIVVNGLLMLLMAAVGIPVLYLIAKGVVFLERLFRK